MTEPTVRVRERVREVPVKPVAPVERVRQTPAPMVVRERQRPLPEGYYYPPPGRAAIQKEIDEWRETTRVREVPKVIMPEAWPNGSAMMRGSNTPGWRRYRPVMGEPEEKNPNLIGRSVPAGRLGGYNLWRWRYMRYEYVGKFRDHGEMFAALRK